MLTYAAKLLLVPALVTVALAGLAAFLVCRLLIAQCVAGEAEEDPAG